MGSVRKIATPDVRESYVNLKRKYETYLRMVNDFSEFMPDGMLKGPHKALKSQLSQSNREAILAYMNKPSSRLWHEICTIMVRPGKNLWEACAEIDNRVITSIGNADDEPQIPTPDDLRLAIVNHMEEEYSRCQDALEETKRSLSTIEFNYHIPVEVKLQADIHEAYGNGSFDPRS